jgi:hypothetical protein
MVGDLVEDNSSDLAAEPLEVVPAQTQGGSESSASWAYSSNSCAESSKPLST